MTSLPRISIVIPCWNEEEHLEACLNSIAEQTVAPFEVVVVDNNSTDNSVAIANKYAFVRVVTEPVQGITPTRNRGMNAATGDVIGRIDADLVLERHWVERLGNAFADPSCMAVTGPLRAPLVPHRGAPKSTLWSRLYFLGAITRMGIQVQLGANTAMRRTVWQEIYPLTCPDDTKVHEDQDVSLCLARCGYKVHLVKNLIVITDDIAQSDWPRLREYLQRGVNTRDLHRATGTYDAPNFPGVPLWRRIATSTLYPPLILFITMSISAYCLRKIAKK